ncbi:hypothetical protein PVK06_001233 [Gossypium arboreum]|uniref:Uncharacterized protein n=1 Tax=Gossypium arboreum TaxID=29729 RepID=A0ABR0R0H0_GOSAR|nr:hypothetical protein PVK06_001233 [Gossypium arboreum]
MQNHESRPTGSTPFSKTNVTSYNRKDKGHTSSCGQGHGHGRGRGRGRGRGHSRGRGHERGGRSGIPTRNGIIRMKNMIKI